MSPAARAAFTALPLAALGVVLWMLLRLQLPLAWRADWVPALGVALAFHVDGLAMLMLLMITGIGMAVFVYAGGCLAGHPQQRRLYLMLGSFMVAMIGCVTADDLM